MAWFNRAALLLLLAFILPGCLRYSFTGVSIPENVRTIHFPFFQDQSPSGQSYLPETLNSALLDQFINQSRLRFTPEKERADAVLEGKIVGYSNKMAIVGGSGTAQLNEITVTVQAEFRFTTDAKPVFSKNFTASAQFDPNTNPIQGEQAAARRAMEIIARNMFTDSLAKW